MADYTTALAAGQLGPSPADNGRIFEDALITGGAGGSTAGSYTTEFVKRPEKVLGPFSYSISGQAVALAGPTLAQGATEIARIIGLG